MPKYQLSHLKRVPSPLNTDDYNWFYYVITNEVNHITGYREGSKKEVAQYLKETLTRLNQKYVASSYNYQYSARKAFEPGSYY